METTADKATLKRKKILFTYPNASSFVKNDVSILSQQFTVSCFEFTVKNKVLTPLVLLKQFFYLLFMGYRYDIFICQFAAYHSLLPAVFAKIYGKPCLIILGGTDCAAFPSINYGNYVKKLLSAATARSIKMASHLAPKHESLIYFKYDYDNHDYEAQGVKCFVKNFQTPYTVIHNGYDADKWKRTTEKKSNSFITVAAYNNPNIIPLKGIDLIMEVAPNFPECTFTVVGIEASVPALLPRKDKLGSNIVWLPEQDAKRLQQLFSEHEFYLQLSMSEGFPNAICEAMLCECIPVGSAVNAIPDIIGDTGFILKRRDAGMLKELLATALSSDKNRLSKAARERIATHFSIEIRREKLITLVDSLIA